MTPDPTPSSQAPPTNRVPITIWPGGYEALKLYERELATYLRELPRLLEEGHAGRHTLVKGDEILGIWDTQGEAIEAGRDRFGLIGRDVLAKCRFVYNGPANDYTLAY